MSTHDGGLRGVTPLLPPLFASAVFGATGTWSVTRLFVRPLPGADRVSAAWQVLLAVAMIAFAWGVSAFAPLQIVLGTGGALWFAFLVFFRTSPAAGEQAAAWYAVAVMASAAWIGVAAQQRSPRADGVSEYATPLVPAPPPGGIVLEAVPTVVLGIGFAVAAGVLFLRVVRDAVADRPPTGRASALDVGAVTAVGMSYALLVLLPRSS